LFVRHRCPEREQRLGPTHAVNVAATTTTLPARWSAPVAAALAAEGSRSEADRNGPGILTGD
jgi:hypothetical protein